MQLTCPNCGQHVPSDKVNIQKMVAVCPACDTVFAFEPPQEKTKRRKVKQPRHIIVPNTDEAHLAFRTNFRLERSESFITGVTWSVTSTVVSLLLIGMFRAATPFGLWLSLISALITLASYYWLGLLVYNKTHIEMDDERITVSRKPIPALFNRAHTVSLADVAVIRAEETPLSKEKGYDTPRYHVWAETVDGRRKLIVSDVTEDYGLFIAQYLNEHLESDTDVDVSRLSDDEPVNGPLEEHDTFSHQTVKADRR